MPFKKGQSGNPGGSSKRTREMSAIKRLTVEQVSEVGTVLLGGNKDALADIGRNPKSTVLQVWMAGLVVHSLKTGDASIFRAVMDRIVGKPREHKTLVGSDGGAIVTRSETDEEKVARIEQLRADRKLLDGDG